MLFELQNFFIELRVTRIANIHYFNFTNGYNTKQDFHNFHELVYVDSGDIIVESEGYDGVVQAGQLIIHKPREKHALSCTTKEAPSVIIIGFESDTSQLNSFSYCPFNLNSAQKNTLAEIIKESRSVFQPPYDIPNQSKMLKKQKFVFGADQLINNLLEYFLIKLIRGSNTTDLTVINTNIVDNDELIAEIKLYIDDNINQRFSITTLCKLFNTNRTTLCQRFKDSVGHTIIDYVNISKLNKAKKYIRQGNKTYTEIADELNFGSVHYFSNIFKKYENVSPTIYSKTIHSKFS